MNNLKEKNADQLASFRLHRPITEDPQLQNYFGKGPAPATHTHLTFRGESFERLDPLPSMFRDEKRAFAPEEPKSRSLPINILAGVSPYIAAVLLCVLVSGVAVHVSTAKTSEEDAAKLAPATRTEAKDRAFGAAAPALSPPLEHRVSAAKPSQPSSGEAWSQTVEVYRQLLAQQQQREPQQAKQADNERFLGQLETWMNKTR